MASRFETDTAVSPDGPGRWRAAIDPGWWIERGPNGGYVAALVLRAIVAEVGDSSRLPRSLTVHYLSPPVEGPVHIETVAERRGRSLTTVSARLVQDGTTKALALGACAADRDGPAWRDLAMGDPPAPDALPEEPPIAAPTAAPNAPQVQMRERYEYRWVTGRIFSGDDRAESAGWIRLAEPAPLDAHVVAAFTDAWMPAIFSRVTTPVGVPTVDLTIHFREPLPAGDTVGTWCFCRFASRVSAGGFVEEDGEVWSADGRLLAQSRQLAAILTPPP